MNTFVFSNSNKRYHTLDYFYKRKFGCKVCKVSLNAGFTCPNIDGSKGMGGCIYCSSSGSGDYAGNPKDHLVKQFHEVKKIMQRKWPVSKYIGYFQAHSNTYAPLPVLKEKYECILNLKDVVGLSIATRCDCISEECLDYLEALAQKTDITVELGLQTIHKKTSLFIHRCHTTEEVKEMVYKLKKRKINVVLHIINGLPYETKEMMVQTAQYINTLPIDGVKIHMLHVLKHTRLGQLYQEKPFPILTKEEYIDIVCTQLEYLRETIVIHRITGDPVIEDLIEPKWLIQKRHVLNDIDKEMKRRNIYQGDKVNKK